MTKKELIEHIAEKARISAQRAELAYDAFWEAILSELKTGHFSLPFGTGVINIKSKGNSVIKEEKGKKPSKAAKKAPVAKKKAVAKARPAKKSVAKKTSAKKSVKSKKKK